jgi:hypothetical protein
MIQFLMSFFNELFWYQIEESFGNNTMIFAVNLDWDGFSF